MAIQIARRCGIPDIGLWLNEQPRIPVHSTSTRRVSDRRCFVVRTKSRWPRSGATLEDIHSMESGASAITVIGLGFSPSYRWESSATQRVTHLANNSLPSCPQALYRTFMTLSERRRIREARTFVPARFAQEPRPIRAATTYCCVKDYGRILTIAKTLLNHPRTVCRPLTSLSILYGIAFSVTAAQTGPGSLCNFGAFAVNVSPSQIDPTQVAVALIHRHSSR
ncbi:hypothetical protein IMY05_C4702000200 [Salix suchowensis]|nr:hypothetical protein IMY05_C4702000200 [Salix suchowensis]